MPKFFLPIVAVLAIAGFAAVGAGYLLTRAETADEAPSSSLAQATTTPQTPTPSPAASPSPTPSPGSSDITPIPGWTVLTNTAYGYSIQYPADWLVNPYQPSSDPSTSNYVQLYDYQPPEIGTEEPLPPEKLKVEIVVLPNPDGLPVDVWVNNLHMDSPSEENVVSSMSITVNGITGIKQVISARQFEFFTVFLASGKNVFVINGPQTDSSHLELYEPFLTTFRLIP